MPVDRPLAADLAQTLVDLYTDTQTRLAVDIARRLDSGMAAPNWALAKLDGINSLRRFGVDLLQDLDTRMGDQVAQAAVLAYVRGGRAAAEDLGRANSRRFDAALLGDSPSAEALALIEQRAAGAAARLAEARRSLPGLDALNRLVFSLAGRLRGTHTRILRWQEDAYREVIARTAAPDVLLGLATRRRAAQVAWEELLTRGVTGFVDRSGRGWNLASYVEMATRTTVAQAAVEGHLDRLGEAGLDLVIVSDAPQECERCRPWEGKILTRGDGPGGRRKVRAEHATIDGRQVDVRVAGSVREAVSAGLMHPNCFPAEVLVSAPSGVVAADARWYEGPLVVIHTARGDQLPVTPNHPVLTPEGWIPAGLLQEGQSVLRYRSNVEQPALGAPDDQQVPARIGDVFDALRESSTMPAFRVPVAPEQFHGDGFGSDVDVVLADGLLGNSARQVSGNGQLFRGGVRLSSLLASRPALQVFDGAGHAAHGLVGGGDLGGALLCRHGRPFPSLGRAPVGAVAAAQQRGAHGGLRSTEPGSDLVLGHAVEMEPDGFVDPVGLPLLGHASVAEFSVEGGPVDAHGGRDLVRALAGRVAADCVVKVEQRREWSGHVYNLQTGDGWYIANSLLVSNCRHSLSAYLPGVTRIPTNTEDPEGDAARQKLRALERKVRKEKLLAEAAIDPAAKKAHEAKVRQTQGQIREHVKATGLHRQPARESIVGAR